MLIGEGEASVAGERLPGAEALTGRGVYYGAALTEAMGCSGADVFIVGGGNSAGQAAVYFADYARTVTLVVRGAGLEESMSQYLIDQIGRLPNVRVQTRTRVLEVHGGLVATLVDTAMGLAFQSCAGRGERCTTLNLNVTFIGAVRERQNRLPDAAAAYRAAR